MAAFHEDLNRSREQRAQDEQLRLLRERARRERLAKARQEHFHTSLPPQWADEDSDQAEAAAAQRKRPGRSPRAAASPPSKTPRPHVLRPTEELAAHLQENLDAWHALEACYKMAWEDIPWLTSRQLDLLSQHGGLLDKNLRKGLRVVWHPDRFSQHFGGRITSELYPRILKAVTDTSQHINALLSKPA